MHGMRPSPGTARRSFELVEEPERPAPGKRSRTAGLRGHASELAPFPHRAAIERAFEQAVPDRARLGAADDCAAIGAEAFAVGDQVAFARREPALHTAAHEAAHVLQERSGAGGATDLDAHAEQAAALVVQGQSAAHLFGGAAAAREVRRRPEGTAEPKAEPAAGGPPEAPVMQFTLFKKKILTPEITVSGNLVIGGSPGQTGRVEVSAGPGAEWSLDRLRQPAGKKAARVARRARARLDQHEAGGAGVRAALRAGGTSRFEVRVYHQARGRGVAAGRGE